MITVVYCTREANSKHTDHIIKSSGMPKMIQVIEIVNNGEALTKAYNRGLEMAKNDIVVFMHDDVTFDNSGWGKKLLKHFQETDYGILGLAGTTDIPETGKWWEDRQKMVGIVNHESGGKKWESKYSKSWEGGITEVAVVDGLFFAVNKKRIHAIFDETIDGFHFYELDFVLSNHLDGVKVGVIYNIRVTHKSIGQTNAQWESNRVQFSTKFADKLPIKLVPDFPESEEIADPKIDTPIKVIIQSSGDGVVLENLYNKIISFGYPSLSVVVISNESNFEDLKHQCQWNPAVKVYEGFYDSLPKNLSVLKFEDDFITKSDELVVFMNDNVKIINNILTNFAKLYKINKNTFGGAFPLAYNENRTIFSSSLSIFADKENKVGIDMRDGNSYYNVQYGYIVNALGNLADCFATTANNLVLLDWFKNNFETPMYFNEFALRLYLKKKIVYNDTNSLTVQKSFSGQHNIQQDFQTYIDAIASDVNLQALVKQIK